MSFVRNEGYTPQQGLDSVGPGWAKLVGTVFAHKPPAIKVVQVKEKFGALRVYYDGDSERFAGIVTAVEELSYYTCEDCGAPGQCGLSGGYWRRTQCRPCVDKDKAERSAK